MSILRRTGSSYGRLVAKPDAERRLQEIIYEENITLQDQIESLRTKISLKERYNKVQREEVDECKDGGNVILNTLWAETSKLRTQLVEALNAEKKAVHNALRSHRDFQLALQGQVPAFAIGWLSDKLFNMTKRMNNLLHSLACKRQKLKESEDLIRLFEQAPRPGSSKWEQATLQKCRKLEYDIENVKVKCETANILFMKYKEIKHILMAEKGKYAPTLRILENQLVTQRKELEQLKKMLGEAVVFQNDAVRSLGQTEKEASENRRRRRQQMARMKKAVQKILEENMAAAVAIPGELGSKSRGDVARQSTNTEHGGSEYDSNAVLRIRKLEVERYQDKARRLVDCMRVPDLTFIPDRLKAVRDLADRLERDKNLKEQRRDFLIKQRDQLMLIFNYMSYTGQKTELDFKAAETSMIEKNEKLEVEINDTMKKVYDYGEIIVDVRLAIVSILELLSENAAKRKQPRVGDIKELLKHVNFHVTKLTSDIQALEKQVGADAELPDKEALKSYTHSAPVPNRLIRVGTPTKERESDDDEYDDIKVPSRQEIKARSGRILANGLLKRGVVRQVI